MVLRSHGCGWGGRLGAQSNHKTSKHALVVRSGRHRKNKYIEIELLLQIKQDA